MPVALIDKLAEHGVTGLLLALALYAIYRLYGALEKSRAKVVAAQDTCKAETAEAKRLCSEELEAVQQARFEDQAKFQAQLLELVRQSSIAITDASNAAESQKAASTEVRSSFDKLAEELRRIVSNRR